LQLSLAFELARGGDTDAGGPYFAALVGVAGAAPKDDLCSLALRIRLAGGKETNL